MSRSFTAFFLFLLALTPLIYLGIVYNELPQTVPTHYNIENEPDIISNKSALWVLMGILAAASLGMYLLLANINSIDPKRTQKYDAKAFRKLGAAMVIIFAALNFNIVLHTQYPNTGIIENLHIVLLGIMLVLIGNFLVRHSKNEVPTSAPIGKIWLTGGVLIVLCSSVRPIKSAHIIMLIILGIIVVLSPLMYARGMRANKNNNTK